MKNSLIKNIKIKYLALMLIILLGFVSASASAGYDCADINLGSYWVVWSVIALMIGVAVVVIAYLFGTIMQHPRALVWAKTEVLHLIISALLIGFAASLVTFACSDALPSIFGLSGSRNMFYAADDYLSDQAELSYKSMTAFRYNLGVSDIRASQIRWEPRWEGLFFGGGQGSSYSPHAGHRSYASVFNTGLNAGTIYLLDIYFLYYVLNYVFYGLAVLFPLGILLRSFPFLRNFGSALIALSLGLFIFFPFMLMFNDATWGVYLEEELGEPTEIDYYSNLEDEREVWNPWVLEKEYNPGHDSLPVLGDLATLSAMAFVGAIFLPAINWIIIIVLIRDISKFLGQEVDVRRLARMV